MDYLRCTTTDGEGYAAADKAHPGTARRRPHRRSRPSWRGNGAITSSTTATERSITYPCRIELSMPDLSRQAILDATCFDVNRSTAEELDHQDEQLTVGLAVTNADRSTVFALEKTMLRLAHRSCNTVERCCTGRVDQEGGVAVCCTAQHIAAQHSTKKASEWCKCQEGGRMVHSSCLHVNEHEDGGGVLYIAQACQAKVDQCFGWKIASICEKERGR